MPLFTLLLAVLAADPAADLDRGRALASAGDLAGAAEQYRKVTAVFPTWGLAQIELAEVLIALGGDDPGLDRTLTAARTLEPLNPRAWTLSGRWADRRGDLGGGLDCWSRVVQLRPDVIEARERLGALLVAAGRAGEAGPHLARVVEARPEDRTTRAILAEVLEGVGDLAGAEVQLRALVAAAPKNPSYRRRLTDFLERTGQAQKAAAEARRADELRPGRKLRALPPSPDRH